MFSMYIVEVALIDGSLEAVHDSIFRLSVLISLIISGITDLHPVYATLFAKGRSLYEKNPQNIVNGPSSSTEVIICKVVFKPQNRNVCYQVSISPLNGTSNCTCETFLSGDLKLCEHIASVSVKEELVDLIMAALAKNPADLRTSLLGKPHGGKKPGMFLKHKSAGHTQREKLTVLPTIQDFDEYRSN